MGGGCSLIPFVGMVLAVTALAVNTIVSKVAMSSGTSFFILSVYSNALATLILFPCGFLFHRSKRPRLTFPVLCRIFLLAFFGCLADIGSYAGIQKSSPTLATELLNLVPGFTYIIAIIFRMEVLNLRRSSDIAKSLGTILSIAGASVVTFFKGPEIMNKMVTLTTPESISPSQQNWFVGGILLATAGLSTAAWSIVQASILKIYPAEMIVVAFYCLFVTMQSTAVALIAEKDAMAWKLQAHMGLVAVVYAGVINITFRLYMMSWCLWRTGPLYVSLFYPLTIVISVVIGVLFFNEVLYLGSVAGAAVLVIGFYAVIWGKSEESKISKVNGVDVESTDNEVPLLHDRIEEAS
ncbi:WAT1-related protein At5g40240-like isoform X2 [Andrographis paniculata]|uniref:WAT1-related protein At5g40240-like isoform X2 n=1 Tax=Andrographis paniculata TaxID=175694 RepID=UPI0021E98EFA|nr:WAT1-related protein At5g40240-like isoform X2 [Andrographis paniculata]